MASGYHKPRCVLLLVIGNVQMFSHVSLGHRYHLTCRAWSTDGGENYIWNDDFKNGLVRGLPLELGYASAKVRRAAGTFAYLGLNVSDR